MKKYIVRTTVTWIADLHIEAECGEDALCKAECTDYSTIYDENHYETTTAEILVDANDYRGNFDED